MAHWLQRTIPLVALGIGAAVQTAPGTEPPSAPPTTMAAATTTLAPGTEVIEMGTSVQGRPITAERRGDPDGLRVVVIGAIHGDEDAGLAILDELRLRQVPPGINLYLVQAINPDGVANQTRGNANGVDLNRNFPYNWGPIAEPGVWEYSGPEAASEPETQATMEFLTAVQPDLVIWYHQDYFRIAPADGLAGEVRQRYSDLSGIPILEISGGTYTGVAGTWTTNSIDGVISFIVELAAELNPGEAAIHADAILTVSSELAG